MSSGGVSRDWAGFCHARVQELRLVHVCCPLGHSQACNQWRPLGATVVRVLPLGQSFPFVAGGAGAATWSAPSLATVMSPAVPSCEGFAGHLAQQVGSGLLGAHRPFTSPLAAHRWVAAGRRAHTRATGGSPAGSAHVHGQLLTYREGAIGIGEDTLDVDQAL